jgi:hypothetical protein
MKVSGLNIMRSGGGVGQMTEREWPIVEKMIDSIDATMTEDEARNVIEEIGVRIGNLAKMGKEKFNTEWTGSQFWNPNQSQQSTQPKRIRFDAQGNMVQ